MQTKRTTVETPQEGPTKTPYQLALENHLSNTRKQALTTLIEQLEAFIKQTTTWYRNDSDKGYLAILNTLKNTIESPTEGQTISEQLTELVKQVMLSRYRGETVPYLSALQAIEASCKLPTEEKAPDQQQADNDKSITTRASLDTALTPAAANAVDEEQTPICSLFSCFSTLFSSRHKTLPQDDTVDVTQNEKSEDQKKQNKRRKPETSSVASIVNVSVQEDITEVIFSRELAEAYDSKNSLIAGYGARSLLDLTKAKLSSNRRHQHVKGNTAPAKRIIRNLQRKHDFNSSVTIYKFRPRGSLRGFYVMEDDTITVLDIMNHQEYDLIFRKG